VADCPTSPLARAKAAPHQRHRSHLVRTVPRWRRGAKGWGSGSTSRQDRYTWHRLLFRVEGETV